MCQSNSSVNDIVLLTASKSIVLVIDSNESVLDGKMQVFCCYVKYTIKEESEPAAEGRELTL